MVDYSGMMAGGDWASFAALGIALMLVVLVFLVAIYIYMSFAYMAVAKKARDKMPGLAWIPFVGPYLIAFRSANMHWWPWLLCIGIVIPFIGKIAMVVFWVFGIVWHWKLFEKIRRPGWWAILMIIPVVNLIILGVAAWSKK